MSKQTNGSFLVAKKKIHLGIGARLVTFFSFLCAHLLRNSWSYPGL